MKKIQWMKDDLIVDRHQQEMNQNGVISRTERSTVAASLVKNDWMYDLPDLAPTIYSRMEASKQVPTAALYQQTSGDCVSGCNDRLPSVDDNKHGSTFTYAVSLRDPAR